jgi:hypothetical protein
VVVRTDAGELNDQQPCPDEPPMRDAVYTDDHAGALWNSQVRDAGAQCRMAFRDRVKLDGEKPGKAAP